MNINWDLVVDCLGIMGKGMLGIFLVIAVIWALVALLNKVTGKRGGESGSPRVTRSRRTRAQEAERRSAQALRLYLSLGSQSSQ